MAHTASDQFSNTGKTILTPVAERPGKCKKHGDYVDLMTLLRGNEVWSGCPQCGREETERQRRLDERARHEEWIEGRKERLRNGSGVPMRFQGKTFADYEAKAAKQIRYLDTVTQYTDLICSDDHGGRSLIMAGFPGTGKTHLGCAMVEAVIDCTMKPAAYVTLPDLTLRIRSTYEKGSDESEADIYDSLCSKRLVVLDEIGVQKESDFETRVAYAVINGRYEQCLPTVVITNLSMKEVTQCLGDRVVDRLRENGGIGLVFDWASFRKGGAA